MKRMQQNIICNRTEHNSNRTENNNNITEHNSNRTEHNSNRTAHYIIGCYAENQLVLGDS